MNKKYFDEAFSKGRYLSKQAILEIDAKERDIISIIDDCDILLRCDVQFPKDQAIVTVYFDDGSFVDARYTAKLNQYAAPSFPLSAPIDPVFWHYRNKQRWLN